MLDGDGIFCELRSVVCFDSKVVLILKGSFIVLRGEVDMGQNMTSVKVHVFRFLP